jgi:hypothetical protein
MNFTEVSTMDLVDELRALNGDLNDDQLVRKMYIGIELDKRIIAIQDALVEFDDLSKADYMTLDAILIKLRVKIGGY